MNGLFAREEEGVKVLLPVWHGVDKATVSRWSPILADRIAADTKNGIAVVAQVIAQAILATGRGSNLAAQFVAILEKGPNPIDVSIFFSNYQMVLMRAVGFVASYPGWTMYRVRDTGEKTAPDLVVHYLISPTTQTWGHLFFFFCPVEGPFFEGNSASGALADAIERWKRLPSSARDDPTEMEGERGRDRGIIVTGRRDRYSERDRHSIRALQARGIEVRSYDWLIEACASTEQQ